MIEMTHDIARHALDAAVAKAQDIKQPVNIAVVDEGANLVAFIRMDGAFLASIDIAQRKAYTAMALQMDTDRIGPLTQPGAPLYGLEHSSGGLVSFGGGKLLRNAKGALVGAVGVSGGSVEQDEAIAAAGAAACSSKLG